MEALTLAGVGKPTRDELARAIVGPPCVFADPLREIPRIADRIREGGGGTGLLISELRAKIEQAHARCRREETKRHQHQAQKSALQCIDAMPESDREALRSLVLGRLPNLKGLPASHPVIRSEMAKELLKSQHAECVQ